MGILKWLGKDKAPTPPESSASAPKPSKPKPNSKPEPDALSLKKTLRDREKAAGLKCGGKVPKKGKK